LLQEKTHENHENKLTKTTSEQQVPLEEEKVLPSHPSFEKPEIKYIKSKYYEKNFDADQTASGSKIKKSSKYDRKPDYPSKFGNKNAPYAKNNVTKEYYKKDQQEHYYEVKFL
jgi:hypothetical protein